MNQNTKEEKVSVGAIMFLLGVVMIIASILIYSKAEDNSFSTLLNKQNEQSGKLRELENLLNSNISTIAANNLRVQDCEKSNTAMKTELERMRIELDVFRDQVGDTREKQIHLRDALSRRTSNIKLPTGPIQIEIMGGSSKPRVPKPQQTPPPVPPKKGPLGKGIKAVMEGK